MAAAKKETTDPRGLKRICSGCGARFYDMNKRPIVCPTCDTEFTGEIKVKSRRGRVAAATEAEEKKVETANDGEVEAEDTADVDVVSLDDAAADEKNTDDGEEETADADLDLDALEGDDDEESEEDLSGLEGDVDLSVETEKE